MFCGKCGKEISDDQKFCMYCGAETGIAPMVPRQEIPNIEATEENSKKSRKKKGNKKKHKAVRVVIPVLVFLVVAAAAVGVAVHFLNPEEEYYLAKTVYYELADSDDPGKGLEMRSTVECRQDGQTIHEETKYTAVTDYTYDENNRVDSIKIYDKDNGETYSFSVTYEERDGIYIGKTNVVSVDDGDSVYREYHYNSEDRLIYTATYNNDELVKYEKTEYNQNGDVKIVESYDAVYKTVTEYDEDGRVVVGEVYSDNGEWNYKYENEYKDDKLYKNTFYDSDGGISSTTVFSKNEGNKTEYIEYDKDNNLNGYTVHTYDDNDHLIMVESFDETRNRTDYYYSYTYDENGNCILSEFYQDGSIYSKTENTYALKKK